jgi:hypothetical protein
MPLYTFIVDYKGFTCVQQASGNTLKEALKSWAELFKLGDPAGLPGNRNEIADSLSKDVPTPLKGARNVWCITQNVFGKLALMNIVETCQQAETEKKSG